MVENGKVSWTQFLTVIITLVLAGVAGFVTVDNRSNDRFSNNRNVVTELMKENQTAHTVIMVDLREIKTRLGIRFRNEGG